VGPDFARQKNQERDHRHGKDVSLWTDHMSEQHESIDAMARNSSIESELMSPPCRPCEADPMAIAVSSIL
jgi:hypothetical protein